MIVSYKGIDQNGNKVKAKIEATSLNEAKKKLKSQKIIYHTIKEEKDSFVSSISFQRRKALTPKELSSLSRELAMYIRSGMTIVSAIKISQSHYENNKKMYLFLKTLSTYLDEGKNLYRALEEQTVIKLPDFFKQSIKVSETSGILDEVLEELARFLKEQDRLNKDIQTAFAYPSFMLIISLFMVGFMLTFVVPKITSIFENMEQELPAITEYVIATGNFFQSYYMQMSITIVAAVALFIFLMNKSKPFKFAVDALLLKTPLFGTIIIKSELGRFAYMGSLLVRSGVTFVQTINLSANIIKNSVIRKAFLEASMRVVEGKTLSKSLVESGFKIDPSFVKAIALAEETSQVENVLSNISQLYFEENKDKITVLLSLLEPILMLFVGGTIGFIVTAMLLPIFSMSVR